MGNGIEAPEMQPLEDAFDVTAVTPSMQQTVAAIVSRVDIRDMFTSKAFFDVLAKLGPTRSKRIEHGRRLQRAVVRNGQQRQDGPNAGAARQLRSVARVPFEPIVARRCATSSHSNRIQIHVKPDRFNNLHNSMSEALYRGLLTKEQQRKANKILATHCNDGNSHTVSVGVNEAKMSNG